MRRSRERRKPRDRPEESWTGHRHHRLSSHIYRAGGSIYARAGAARLGRPRPALGRHRPGPAESPSIGVQGPSPAGGSGLRARRWRRRAGCGRPGSRRPSAEPGPRLSQDGLSRTMPAAVRLQTPRRVPATRIQKAQPAGSAGHRQSLQGPPPPPRPLATPFRPLPRPRQHSDLRPAPLLTRRRRRAVPAGPRHWGSCVQSQAGCPARPGEMTAG